MPVYSKEKLKNIAGLCSTSRLCSTMSTRNIPEAHTELGTPHALYGTKCWFPMVSVIEDLNCYYIIMWFSHLFRHGTLCCWKPGLPRAGRGMGGGVEGDTCWCWLCHVVEMERYLKERGEVSQSSHSKNFYWAFIMKSSLLPTNK